METDLCDATQILKKYKQEHLLSFYEELDDDEKAELIAQIHSTNFEKINNLYLNSMLDDSISYNKISPIPYVEKSSLSDESFSKYFNIGKDAIKDGKLAIITLAGGQGTRLGYKGPKGSYEIDVPPKKSLFEFVCDNLKEVQSKYGVTLNWYIMTSPANDTATRNFFEEKNYFGYPKDVVKFFVQGTLPVIDTGAKVIMESTHSIKTGSNGNGDVFKSFFSAGFMADVEKSNIEWFFIGGIDNILLNWADEVFLGLAIAENYDVASKSIRKNTADCPDWVFANVNGHPSIIDPKNIPACDYDKYSQKNILAHLFSVSAFKQLQNVSLPYHRAFKKCDFINDEGMKEVATKPNSFKFEKFIFDAFAKFDKILLLEVPCEKEFAPIKAFTGCQTPETALELYKKAKML